MADLSFTAAGILLVFYLYLLVKPAAVKRNPMFLIGACGLVLVLIGSFFGPWAAQGRNWARVLLGIFTVVGTLAAFGGAFLACYGGRLPIDIPGMESGPAPGTGSK